LISELAVNFPKFKTVVSEMIASIQEVTRYSFEYYYNIKKSYSENLSDPARARDFRATPYAAMQFTRVNPEKNVALRE
jgi:hypothetical protein